MGTRLSSELGKVKAVMRRSRNPASYILLTYLTLDRHTRVQVMATLYCRKERCSSRFAVLNSKGGVLARGPRCNEAKVELLHWPAWEDNSALEDQNPRFQCGIVLPVCKFLADSIKTLTWLELNIKGGILVRPRADSTSSVLLVRARADSTSSVLRNQAGLC